MEFENLNNRISVFERIKQTIFSKRGKWSELAQILNEQF